jgi:hypothetical protein
VLRRLRVRSLLGPQRDHHFLVKGVVAAGPTERAVKRTPYMFVATLSCREAFP